ncbi:MAG: GGDEF domain-containing protein [Proteobacteria bacterium]|nr:GGDEF domain-containing protein [Pseudomonadota bacterium]
MLVVMSLDLLSTGRAYVGGEGYWSKAQKDSVFHLMRYARSFDPADYDAFRSALAVPLGDRKAREALDRSDPDYESARRGFIEGRNDPADVDGMARFFVRFRNVSYIARAIGIWAEGDREIALLQAIAGRLHAEIGGRRDPARIDAYLGEIRTSNQRLAPLEDAFSQTLGDASRVLRDLLVAVLAAAAAAIIGAAVLVVGRMLRRVDSAEAAHRESEARLRLVADGVPALISYVDREQRYRYCNRTYQEWYGIGQSRMIGRTIREVFGDANYAALRPSIERALVGENVRFEHASHEGGRTRVLQVTYIPHRDDGDAVVGFYLMANDVSALKRTQDELRAATDELARNVERLQIIAHHDALTGLPNRVMFGQQAGQILSRTRRHGGCAALLFIDLDGFKEVNDLCGHSVGDELLRTVAARLGANIRNEDVAARLGGDEFCVILDAMRDLDTAEAAARNLAQILNQPYAVAGRELGVTASVGVSCFPRDGEDFEALLQKADADMYRDKRRLRSVSGGR